MSDFPASAKAAALSEYINLFSNKTDYERKSSRLMQESTNMVLQRVKANIDVAVQEQAEPVINKFVNNLTESLVSISNSWIDGQKKKLMVVPEGTKFVSRDGDTVNLIVEQRPTMRTINYLDRHYRIALPFVQFIFSFKHNELGNDRLHELKVTCTKKPISSLDDNVYYIPLPNTGYSRICVGLMLDDNIDEINHGTNLCQKADAIIAQYWGSNFNEDLPEYFHAFLMGAFNKEYQEYMKAPRQSVQGLWQHLLGHWVAASASNPFFFNDVPATCFTHRRLGEFIVTSYAGEDGVDCIIKNIRDNVSIESRVLANSIAASISDVDLSEENRLQPHKATLSKEIQSFCVWTLDSMWNAVHGEHEKNVLKDNTELDKKRRDVETIVRRHESIVTDIQERRELLERQKKMVQQELYAVYQHLVSELEKVAELKAKLAGIVDDEGNIIKKRGKVKREPDPAHVVTALDRVAASHALAQEEGLLMVPIIKRKRGRPRKES